MTTTSVEVERKYDVGAHTRVPELTGLSAGVREAKRYRLAATYYDTEDLRLRAAKTTLRRRTGGTDAGWHLKMPLPSDRLEIRLESARPPKAVPAELRTLVRAVVRRAELVPVAELVTQRTVHHLVDADGAVLIELADDKVTGTPVDGVPVVWREWEAELVSGDPALLDVLHERLLEAGAHPSDSASKVGRVLASRAGSWWASKGRRDDDTAGGVVRAHLVEQVTELVRRDPDVRRDAPDSVHRMRVATRRLRSALQTFRPLLERSVTDPVREELTWLAHVLGEARDAEVMRDRLLALLDAEDPADVVGPVRERIESTFGQRYDTAHAAVVQVLDGERYLDLLEALHALVRTPPYTAQAAEPASATLAAAVRKAWRRLDRELTHAVEQEPGEQRDLLLHEARKDAKRARYAAEAVSPAFSGAARSAKAAAALQEALGEHQDGVVTRDALRELAQAAQEAGEPTFTYGRLHGLEQARADAATAGWPQARKEAGKKKVRSWF